MTEEARKVAGFYERFWRESPGSSDAVYRREADADAVKFLAPLENSLVLDLGAGGGAPTDRLLRADARVVAVDIALEPLVALKKRYRERILAVRADAHALPFRTGVFPRAALFSMLMFTRAGEALAEVHRVLAPRGRLAVVEPLRNNPVILLRRLTGKYNGLARWLSREEFTQSLRAKFPDARFHHFTLLPPLALLPAGEARSFLHAVGVGVRKMFPRLRDYVWIIAGQATKG